MGFNFSLSKKTAKIAAYIGARYRNETAVPTGKYFNDIKNKLIAVRPARALNIINLRLLPNIGIFLINMYDVPKINDPIVLKNTISNVGKWFRYLTNEFIRLNENVLMIINKIAFFTVQNCIRKVRADKRILGC